MARQARKALAMYYEEDPALLARVSVSSDAFGSWPVFDERGRLTSYEARAPLQPAQESGGAGSLDTGCAGGMLPLPGA